MNVLDLCLSLSFSRRDDSAVCSRWFRQHLKSATLFLWTGADVSVNNHVVCIWFNQCLFMPTLVYGSPFSVFWICTLHTFAYCGAGYANSSCRMELLTNIEDYETCEVMFITIWYIDKPNYYSVMMCVTDTVKLHNDCYLTICLYFTAVVHAGRFQAMRPHSCTNTLC